MRFASLGSGSRGNATLIEAAGTRLLLDCGFSAREVERRLAELDVPAESLDAILVTHEHQDHIRGVGPLARRYSIPVWITHGTYNLGRCGALPDVRLIHSHQVPFTIGDIEIEPYPVPHDAREPVQYVFHTANAKLGILTDAGVVTPHIRKVLKACDALFLECNHDVEMLANGPYPYSLQQRVGGRLGHLSNHQAADLLQLLGHDRLKYLLAAHLSEKNNTPEMALREAGNALSSGPCRVSLSVAMQDVCGDLLQMEP